MPTSGISASSVSSSMQWSGPSGRCPAGAAGATHIPPSGRKRLCGPRQPATDREMKVDVTTTAVDQTVRRAAVLGSPIMHSLSPVLHGAAYQALHLIGWHYDKIECDEPGLPRLVDSMGPEWAGLSLTMPLKRVALAVADEISPLAEAVGAANTLVFSPAGPAGGRRADNTDVAGMVSALREAGLARV